MKTAHIKRWLQHLLTPLLLITITISLAWLSVRNVYVADWTENSRHTLSETSQLVLEKLDKPVQITAYIREDKATRGRIRLLIERYQRYKDDFHLQAFINPDTVPQQVRELGIKNGDLLITYGDRSERLNKLTEQALTNLLEALSRTSESWVAVLEGHGERRVEGKANHDISQFSKHLTQRGFQVQPINLATVHSVPNNAAMLVIASPLVDLLTEEVDIISDYVDQGGNLLWLTEPGELKGLQPVADKLGLKFYPGTLVDPTTLTYKIQQPTIVLATQYPKHIAVEDFNILTLFPETVAMHQTGNTQQGNSDWYASVLLHTNQSAWSEQGELAGEVVFDKDIDARGPLPFAYALSRTLDNKPEQRIIVIGDGDFLSNAWLGNSGNLDLGLRLMNWLSRNDAYLKIPARTRNDVSFELTRTGMMFMGVGFLLLLPCLLIGTGIFIWLRRRRT